MVPFEKKIITRVRAYLQKEFPSDPTGHDYWHFDRVSRLSKKIASGEKAKVDMFILELGALLHDIGDWKFHDDELAGGKKARKLLLESKVSESIIRKVEHIVDNVSFKGANVPNKMRSREGKIVQDAYRLDALGAIGLARVFATSAYFKHSLFDPTVKPVLHKSFGDYKKSFTAINHFYEKLLLLKDKMNTKTGRKIAKEKHKFTQNFLNKFLKEWTNYE